jgi:hypothetical protein
VQVYWVRLESKASGAGWDWDGETELQETNRGTSKETKINFFMISICLC